MRHSVEISTDDRLSKPSPAGSPWLVRLGAWFCALMLVAVAVNGLVLRGRSSREDAFVMAGDGLATKLGVAIERSEQGEPKLLGTGMYGRIFALEGGTKAIKITEGGLGPEELLAQNLPHTPTLLRVRHVAEGEYEGNVYTGLVMTRIYGKDLTVYGDASLALSSHDIISLAADIAIALHALHTKISGYVVLHCDLAPKNVMVTATEHAKTAIVLDFGLALVHKVQDGRNLTDAMLPEFSEWKRCRGTDWDKYFDGVKPFNAMVEWRELGHILYQLSESILDYNGEKPVTDALFAGRSAGCNYRCAADKNLKRMTRVTEPLKDFIRYLILDHDSIRDEVADVLRHPVFKDVSPAPADIAEGLATLAPSDAFLDFFTGDVRLTDDEIPRLATLLH